MSSEAADRAKYGAGIVKFLAELDANMVAWKSTSRRKIAKILLVPKRARRSSSVSGPSLSGLETRSVRPRRVSGATTTPTARTGRPTREIDALANANYAELAKLRAWISEYSIWHFMFAAATMAGGVSAPLADRSDGRTLPKGHRHPGRVQRGVSGGSPTA